MKPHDPFSNKERTCNEYGLISSSIGVLDRPPLHSQEIQKLRKEVLSALEVVRTVTPSELGFGFVRQQAEKRSEMRGKRSGKGKPRGLLLWRRLWAMLLYHLFSLSYRRKREEKEMGADVRGLSPKA